MGAIYLNEIPRYLDKNYSIWKTITTLLWHYMHPQLVSLLFVAILFLVTGSWNVFGWLATYGVILLICSGISALIGSVSVRGKS